MLLYVKVINGMVSKLSLLYPIYHTVYAFGIAMII